MKKELLNKIISNLSLLFKEKYLVNLLEHNMNYDVVINEVINRNSKITVLEESIKSVLEDFRNKLNSKNVLGIEADLFEYCTNLKVNFDNKKKLILDNIVTEPIAKSIIENEIYDFLFLIDACDHLFVEITSFKDERVLKK